MSPSSFPTPLTHTPFHTHTQIWKSALNIGCAAVQCPQNSMALVMCMVDNGPMPFSAPSQDVANLAPPGYPPTQCGIPG